MEPPPRPSRLLHVATSLAIGFGFSFMFFTAGRYTPLGTYAGQLLAGDAARNAELPTTLNTVRDTMDGAATYGGYALWAGIIFLGIPLSYAAFRFTRRYV